MGRAPSEEEEENRGPAPRNIRFLAASTNREGNCGAPLEQDAGRGRKREGVTEPGDGHREARRLLTPQQPAWDTDRPTVFRQPARQAAGQDGLSPSVSVLGSRT